jgi:hypothetical protein
MVPAFSSMPTPRQCALIWIKEKLFAFAAGRPTDETRPVPGNAVTSRIEA